MAETYKLEIEQRSTFTQTVEYLDSQNQPVDLTGYSAAMQIRRTVESADALLSLTDDSGGGLIITPLLGKIEIDIDAADTRQIISISKNALHPARVPYAAAKTC